MLSSKTKKLISTIIKTSLVLLCFFYLFYKLSVNDFRAIYSDTTSLLSKPGNWFYLLLVFLFMLLNWSIEAKKWEKLIFKLEPLGFYTALKSVLAGVSISLITPNRAGEFVGKIFFLRKANKPDAMLLSMVGSISQVLITFCFGLLSLHYFLYRKLNFISYKIPVLMLVLLLIGVSIYLFFNIKNIVQNWKNGNFVQKLIPYHNQAFVITKNELLEITLLSLFRYAVFSIQYYLLLQFFNLSFSFAESFILIALYFFLTSLIPTYALSELGVRGSVAILLFCSTGSNCAPVFASTLLLWIINLAIPAVIGSVYVYHLKFFKIEND